ncbi:antibiotic biosynthesis monooxygenase [Streptomyces sp. NBC_01186]|uniref:antibiotic biosynthesis monooxygenase family protein n=1 Tax=Streptomyces sp. NBC_01186 TaxID=2903765 RepID=UPI002E103E88|nr:antibiotic biosynthesis monooxygenase [Streptomyces sp. NBC_01186]
MLKFGHIDASTHFHDQQKEKARPVTVINTFVAPEGKEEEVVAAWTDDAEYMKKSGSLLSVQLYRGIGGSRLFTDVAVWKSAEHLRAALGTPEFASHLERYPARTVAYPHLYQKFAVEGVREGE